MDLVSKQLVKLVQLKYLKSSLQFQYSVVKLVFFIEHEQLNIHFAALHDTKLKLSICEWAIIYRF